MNKILNLLGLSARARMITLGEEFVLKTLPKGPDNLVFLASDAGKNISNKITNKTETYGALLITDYTTDELSKAIGKENRKVILITDKGFIKKFKEYLNS